MQPQTNALDRMATETGTGMMDWLGVVEGGTATRERGSYSAAWLFHSARTAKPSQAKPKF